MSFGHQKNQRREAYLEVVNDQYDQTSLRNRYEIKLLTGDYYYQYMLNFNFLCLYIERIRLLSTSRCFGKGGR